MKTVKKRRKKRKGRYQRGEYVSLKTGQVCSYRSGWEARMMQHLDSDPTVVSWTYEQIVIEYISNIRTKKVRKYYPDFYVKYSDGREEIIEVKPQRRLQTLVVRKKTSAGEAWASSRGMTYRLITEVEMKSMGLM